MTQYYSLICATVKDEHEYLAEWVEYHLALGFDHIVIYDNNSIVPVVKFLAEYISLGSVSVVVCPIRELPQLKVYNHCLFEYHYRSKWIAFIDVDEFIDIRDGLSINQFLSDYEHFAGLTLNWKVFNANGHLNKPHGFVTKNFQRATNERLQINRHVKTILQPALTRCISHSHFAHYSTGAFAVNELMAPVEQAYSDFSGQKAFIRHYYTKSYEEWVNKIARGRPDLIDTSVEEELFWKYNPELLTTQAAAREQFLYPKYPGLKPREAEIRVQPAGNQNLQLSRELAFCLELIADKTVGSLDYFADIGLAHGKMGIALYLFSYYRFSGNINYFEVASHTLTEVCKRSFTIFTFSSQEEHLFYSNGISGIITAIRFLETCGAVDTDLDSLLINTDPLFTKFTVDNLTDVSLSTGLIGYGIYYLSKIHDSKDIHDKYNFEFTSINKILNILENIISYTSRKKYKDLQELRKKGPLFILAFLQKVLEKNAFDFCSTVLIEKYVHLLHSSCRESFQNLLEGPAREETTELRLTKLIVAEQLLTLGIALDNPEYKQFAVGVTNSALSLNTPASIQELNMYLQAGNILLHISSLTNDRHLREKVSDILHSSLELIPVFLNESGSILAPDACGLWTGVSGIGMLLMSLFDSERHKLDFYLLN